MKASKLKNFQEAVAKANEQRRMEHIRRMQEVGKRIELKEKAAPKGVSTAESGGIRLVGVEIMKAIKHADSKETA